MDGKGDRHSGISHSTPDWSDFPIPHARRLGSIVRAGAFWSAICLPWVALALLFFGIATSYPLWFTGLIAVAFVAAIVGHDHTRR